MSDSYEHGHGVLHPGYADHQELAISAARDVWGFRDNLSTIANNPLVNINTPIHMARQWTIQLLAAQYQSGSLAAPAFPFLPANNQVFWTNGIYVLIQWGTDRAFEQALVDYPWSGCAFDVYGAQVRVTMAMTPTALAALRIQQASGAPIPNIGAFASPGVGRYYTRGVGSAMYTLPPLGVSSGNIGTGVFFPVPARARNYQLYGTDGTEAIGTAEFYARQVGFGYQSGLPTVGQVVQQDQGQNGLFGGVSAGGEPMMGAVTTGTGGLALASNQSQVRTLAAATTAIQIAPGSDIGTNTYNVGCRFGIDLS